MNSSDAGPTDIPILEETIGENFERTVAANPNGEALVDMASGRRWTYAELNNEIDVVARGLMALGIERGERVGMWAPNCPEWTIVQYATAKIGAILVNINPSYRTHELAYVLKQSGVRTLVSATEFKTSDYVGMVDEVRPDAPEISEVVFLGTDDWTRLVDGAQSVPVDALRARMATLGNDDPINIQYTSGTTGFPKGATLSHRNILNNGFITTELINLGPKDKLCIPVPFYHCFGMVLGNLGCTSHGATMVIPAPGFDPTLTLDALEKERCTAVYGVPTMFIAMLGDPDLADRDLSSMRTGIMAGSVCPVEVMKRAISDMNLTELVHRVRHDRDVARVLPDPHRRRPRTSHRLDRPCPAARRDQDHRPGHRRRRRRGQPGEYCARGYYRDARLLAGRGQDP